MIVKGREKADLTVLTAPDKVCFTSAAAQFILVLIYSHQSSYITWRVRNRRTFGRTKRLTLTQFG